ncbi:type II toxin-antitoxin system RelB family antitoxin [Enterococcus sp. AZ007]|uniref:type II toxin-antitoxin system RelB family antitoxin n=1 Tax=Enterococcus sp. AZ007 TaxID=2774839 RepID=UPI003F20AE87
MAVITIKIPDEDKAFLQAMAKFENVTLSELIRTQTLTSLEEKYDAHVADAALEEYEAYLADGGEQLSWDSLISEVGLND